MAQQINLFNPVFLKQRKLFSTVTMLQGLALIAVATAAFSGYLAWRGRQIEQTVARVEATVAEQRTRLLKFVQEFSPQGRSKLLEEELGRTEVRVKAGEELLDTLRSGDLGNTAGFSAYLAAFARQSVAGVWLVGIRLDGESNQLVVEGRALDAGLVPRYLRALGNEDVMRGRQVDALKLTAREAAPAADPKAAAAPGPGRFVEFTLVAPRRAGAAQEAPPRAGRAGT